MRELLSEDYNIEDGFLRCTKIEKEYCEGTMIIPTPYNKIYTTELIDGEVISERMEYEILEFNNSFHSHLSQVLFEPVNDGGSKNAVDFITETEFKV